MKYIVSKEHTSSYPEPVQFRFGESLKTGEKDTEYDNWIWVTTGKGSEGWAPIQFIDFSDNKGLAIANNDYTARELNVVIGEQLLFKHELNTWGWFENSSGDSGWIPMRAVVADI